MKTIVKKLIRDEKGQVMVLVLILLIVGGLIVAPLLAYMGTGLIAGGVYEKRMAELYAADAGVEDAVWKIQHNEGSLPCSPGHSWSYNITDVNGKKVEYTITYVDALTYRVVSTATGDGSGTKIDAYISANVTYCSIMDHLVTIQDDLTEQQVNDLEKDLGKLDIPCPTGCTECAVCGLAYDYNSDDYRSISQECKGCIAVYNFPGTGWPTADDLSARYWGNVAGGTHYDGNTEIDLEGTSCPLGPIYINDEENSWSSGLGPLYVDGELDIVNSSKDAATLTLTGTLYITGETQIYGPNAAEPYKLTLDLNGQTIFVANNSTKALEIKLCNIVGPGVIIAIGDIDFAPKAEAGVTDPIFVLSVSGTTLLHPSGDFYGAIAGDIDVEIKLGNPDISYPEGGFGPLNFPSLFEARLAYNIATWEVTRLPRE